MVNLEKFGFTLRKLHNIGLWMTLDDGLREGGIRFVEFTALTDQMYHAERIVLDEVDDGLIVFKVKFVSELL